MGQYTSYYLYQKYEQREGQDPIPCIPSIYSIDADGTMEKVIKLENDPDCGYTPPPVEPIYRWYQIPITEDYICGNCAIIFRWVDSGTTCIGYDKWQRSIKQYSEDEGETWQNVIPPIYSATSLIEEDSEDCGYVPPTPVHGDYFSFETIDSGTFSFIGNSISYSLDSGSTWSTLSCGSNTPTVSAGSKIMWKASGLTPSSEDGIGRFASSGRFNVEGNVMSLLYGDDYDRGTSLDGKNYAFTHLFSGNTNLVSAEDLLLPADELVIGCYRGMFYKCTSLTAAPELPATKLHSNCYSSMFQNCSSLTTAPSLIASIPSWTVQCYSQMFMNCTGLTTPPQLPSTTLGRGCYENMFDNCKNLTTAPSLQATTLSVNCYRGMFYDCKKLTTAPELLATTLAEKCYYQMFKRCTLLNSITCLATDISADDCTWEWVNGVASSGTFTKAASMSSWTIGEDGIPSGWSVQS